VCWVGSERLKGIRSEDEGTRVLGKSGIGVLCGYGVMAFWMGWDGCKESWRCVYYMGGD
jgi:hypothetical protein